MNDQAVQDLLKRGKYRPDFEGLQRADQGERESARTKGQAASAARPRPRSVAFEGDDDPIHFDADDDPMETDPPVGGRIDSPEKRTPAARKSRSPMKSSRRTPTSSAATSTRISARNRTSGRGAETLSGSSGMRPSSEVPEKSMGDLALAPVDITFDYLRLVRPGWTEDSTDSRYISTDRLSQERRNTLRGWLAHFSAGRKQGKMADEFLAWEQNTQPGKCCGVKTKTKGNSDSAYRGSGSLACKTCIRNAKTMMDGKPMRPCLRLVVFGKKDKAVSDELGLDRVVEVLPFEDSGGLGAFDYWVDPPAAASTS